VEEATLVPPQTPTVKQGDQTVPPPPTLPSDDIQSVLDAVQTDKSVKADAWDAYHHAKSPQDFQTAFDKLNLPKETKAALWDHKFAGQTHSETTQQMFKRGTPAFKGAQSQPSGNLRDQAIGALPAAGAAAFGAVGAELGPLDIPFTGLGAAAGESARQLIQRGRGKPAPATSGEAAKDIATEGVAGAATEAIGQGLAVPLKPIGRYFSETAARGAKIPLLPSEAGVGGGTSKAIEGFLGHALPSRGIMEDFKEQQLGAVDKVVRDEVSRLSNFQGTPEQAGEQVTRAVEDGRTRMKAEVNSAYKAIDDLTASQSTRVPVTKEATSSLVDESGRPMTYEKRSLEKREVGGVQPATIEVKRAAVGLLREIQQEEKLLDPTLLAKAKTLLTSIVKSPKNVPYASMADSRSDLLAITRQLDEALPGKRAGMAKLLAKKMDGAMMDAAEQSGITGLPQQIRIANSLSAEMHRKFEQDLLTKILDTKKPEVIAGYIKKAGLQEIRDMNATLDEPTRRLVQSHVVADSLVKAFDEKTKQLNPQAFSKAIHSIGDERGKELFGPANWDSVRQMADMVGRVGSGRAGIGSSGASLHNWTYLVALPAALSAAVFGRGEAAMATAGTMAMETYTLRKLAQAITNPAKSARVVHYLQMGARGAPYAIYGLAKLVGGEADEATPEQRAQTHDVPNKKLLGRPATVPAPPAQ
jgi:hypothetical protein